MKEILSEGLTSSLDSFGTFPKSINSPHSPRLEKVHRKAVFYEGFPYIIIYIAIPGIMSWTLCLKCCLSIDLVEGKIVLKQVKNIIYYSILLTINPQFRGLYRGKHRNLRVFIKTETF